MSSANGSHRRALLQNFLTNSREFWARAVIAVLILLPVVALMAGYLLYRVTENVAGLQVEPAVLEHLTAQLRSIGFLFLSVIILLCLLGIYFMFFLSVRVFGPQVALLRFIEQLKAGNYEPYRPLRRDDQLKEIWQALQELAAQLKSRKPNQ